MYPAGSRRPVFKGQGPGLVNVLWARASKHVFVVNATLAHPHNSEIARDFRLRSQWHTRKHRPRRWALHEFLEILLEIRYLLQIRISGNFRGNMHAPAETVSRIFQDTHVQSHFGGRCGVPPPQARKILPQTGPFSSKINDFVCVTRVAGLGRRGRY